MTWALLLLSLISFAQITPTAANADEETLDVYWPLRAPARSWNLISSSDKDQSEPETRMSVANKNTGANQMQLWFSNKPGQLVGSSDVEQYEYCSNTGGQPWLFFDSYINIGESKPMQSHPVRSTRILFTPEKEQTFDLIADGTYARCGNKGQPYLLWKQTLDSYRIQVWGYLADNPKWKWYWDSTITRPALVTNNCLDPPQTVKAIKVQEAWWSNFNVIEGKWNLGTGETSGDGLPTGANVKYGRTVWHAQGQLPYYLTGRADGKTVDWCVKQVTPALEGGQ